MKRLSAILAAAVLGIGMMGCAGKTEGEAAVQSVSALCGYGSVGNIDRYAGVVTSRRQVEVKKNEEQTVGELLVAVGDEVEEGQVLFTYDGEEAALNLEKAKLELERLKNSIESKKNEIETLKADQKKASNDQKLSYTIQIQEAEADIQEAEYNMALKESEIARLERETENLEVTAPVAGTIQTINDKNSGSNEGMSETSSAYIVITETGNYRVKGYINENNVGTIQEGMSILIRSRMDDSQTWSGVIEMIDWENPASASSNSYYYSSDDSSEMTTSSKYPFYIEMDDTEGLLLGQHVYIEPDYGQESGQEEQVIRLSSGFFNDIDDEAWVWAEDDKGKLEKRKVTLGEYDSDLDSYVVTAGLSLDDYIAYPEESLSAGMVCVEYENTYEGDLSGDYGYDGDTEYSELYTEEYDTEDAFPKEGESEDYEEEWTEESTEQENGND